MKKTLKQIAFLTSLFTFSATNFINAQWTTSGNNIYYDKGNVGVGTASPQSLFSLGTALNSKKLALYDGNDFWYGLGIQSAQMRLQIGRTSARFSFFANDTTEIMTLKGTGKLGIGTADPEQQLHIVNPLSNTNIRLRGGNDVNTFTDIYSGAAEAGIWKYGAGGLKFATAGKLRMHITEEGYVGIGTSTPQSILSLGTVINGRKLALHDDINNWYGLGIQSDQMRLQVGGSGDRFSFFAGDTKELMTIKGDGRVGIGIDNPQSELAVNGKITTREVQVIDVGWADFVFDNDYALQPIAEVEKFIKANKHLPGIPTAKKVEQEGIELGKMNALLLQKIEELTLYIIEQNKSMEGLQNEMNEVKRQLQKANYKK